MPVNDPFDSPIRTCLIAIWRFRWRSVFVFLFTVTAAIVALFVLPKEYESEGKLFVRVGRENASLDPIVTSEGTIALSASRETEINSIVEHLRSRSILEETLRSVEPGYSTAAPEDQERLLRAFGESIFIHSPRSSTVIEVHCVALNPERSRKSVATLMDLYLDEHMRVSRGSGSHQFFVEQTAVLRNQLDSSRANLRDAKSAAGMASMEGGRIALETQISAVETRIREVAAALAATNAKLASLEGKLDGIPEALLSQLVDGTPNDGLAGMRQTLFELRTRQEEIASTCTEEHPRLQAIRMQVRAIERSLGEAEPDRQEINRAILAREASEQASLTAENEQLQLDLAQLEAKLIKLNEDELLIAGLTSEVEQLEAKYLTYVEKCEETRMDEALRADRLTNLSIIQPASYVPRPVRPNKANVLMLGLVLGCFGAIAVAITSHQWNAVRQIFDEPDVRSFQIRERPANRATTGASAGSAGPNGTGQLEEAHAGN